MAKGSLLIVAVLLASAAPANAAFPGRNGEIAFVRAVAEIGLPASTSIWKVRPDGTGTIRLTRAASGDDRSPAWSPTGNRIAFVRHFGGTRRTPANFATELMVMNADGSGVRRLTHNMLGDTSPVWSRDGRRLFFVRTALTYGFERPDADIWSITLEGRRTRTHRIARTPEVELEIAMSPRGDRLAYIAAWPERTLRDGIVYWGISDFRHAWTTTLDGRNRRPVGVTSATLTTAPAAGEPLVSPAWASSSRLAFATWNELFSIRLDAEFGYDGGIRNHGTGSDVAWAPDGRQLVTTRHGDDGSWLYVLDSDGGGERRLTPETFERRFEGDSEPDWQSLPR